MKKKAIILILKIVLFFHLQQDKLKTLKTVMSAFHASVSVMAPEEEEKASAKPLRFSAKESSIFNSLATQCLKHTIRILNKNIPYANQKKSKGYSFYSYVFLQLELFWPFNLKFVNMEKKENLY